MATSSNPPLRRENAAANLFRTTMNKFLKKRTPEPLGRNDERVNGFLAGPPPPPSSPPPTNLKKSASRWKRSRKVVDEQKPAFSFDLALPSDEDFRTSLFMPAMTARFSLLREQDDPNSILGKASDDSVLQPRRRSRMDFGPARGGLDDIAEVASVRSTKSSLRPQLIDRRQDSFTTKDEHHSANSSPHSSVMSRSRPGEGNTLFGGRQKVSIVPRTGSSSIRSGRTLYEDDLSIPSFQKTNGDHKLEETRTSNDSLGFDFGLDHMSGTGEVGPDDGATTNKSSKDLSDSPSLSSSENKWSTHSRHSEARSSTAATSVASQPGTSTTSPSKTKSSSPPAPATTSITSQPSNQPLKRTDTKLRRLYEQGLDQHMHEQQTSALTRLNSIHKQQQLSNKHPQLPLHSVKSASNINEKARQQVYALSEQNSPTAGPLLNPFGLNGMASADGLNHMQSPPLSPLPPQYGMDFDEYNTLTQALEPGDRGKATAMGAFNKPKQSFDEEQYLERQRQLQRSVSAAAVKKGLAAKARLESSTNASLPQEYTESNSYDVSRSRSPSAPKDLDLNQTGNTFQTATKYMDSQPDTHRVNKFPLPDSNRTLVTKTRPSDSVEEDDSLQSDHATFRAPDYGYGTHHGKWQPTVLPSVLEHPAFRSKTSKPALAQEETVVQARTFPTTPSSIQNQTALPKIHTPSEDPASENLSPNRTAEGLGGLVQHLRQKSNVSSITQNTDRSSYTDATGGPELTSQNLDLVDASAQRTLTPDSRVASYANSNPWDLDEVDNVARAGNRVSHASISPIDNEQHIGYFEGAFSSLVDRQSAVSELELGDGNNFVEHTEQPQQHVRDSSTATQQDRDAFDNELAARANAIQEKLKSKVASDSQSRGVSPARSISGGFKAFGMLRSQPSRESVEASQILETPANAPSKAQKVLGSNGAGTHLSTSTLNSQRGSDGYSLDLNRTREDSASRPPVPSIDPLILQQSEQEAKRPIQQSRSRENSEIEPFPPANRSPPLPTSARSRTNSVATSGRSRSRTGPYRDDLEKAMVEGTGSSAAVVPDLATLPPWELTPRSTPEINQSPFEPPRSRSGSRAGMTTYFDSKNLHPIMTGSRERLSPGVPSPALTPNPYSPMLSPSPLSPAGSFAHNMTPPLSGASTPLQSAFTPPPPVPPTSTRSGGILRKKTISKGDISEPTLISSTSNIELVDLPEGASLRNGMDDAPPVPPLNPARRTTKRILSLGRKDSGESAGSRGSRSKTPDAHFRRTPEADMPFDAAQTGRNRSDTQSPQKPSSKPSFDQNSGIKANGPLSKNGSPKSDAQITPPPAAIAMDGSMF